VADCRDRGHRRHRRSNGNHSAKAQGESAVIAGNKPHKPLHSNHFSGGFCAKKQLSAKD
jgi:hypothetical protein